MYIQNLLPDVYMRSIMCTVEIEYKQEPPKSAIVDVRLRTRSCKQSLKADGKRSTSSIKLSQELQA